MQQFNMWAVAAVAAIIPLITGAIWYSKPVFGKAWMRTNNFRDEDMRGTNMALKFLLVYVLAFMISIVLTGIVVHQMVLYSLTAGDTSEAAKTWMTDAFARYGNNYRTFKHGALHGTLTGLFIGLPIIGTIAIFERRSFKYVAIHAGYWMLTLALMGGVICQFAKVS